MGPFPSTNSLDIRNQLSLERDSVQRLTLQRELEAKELQSRLDKQVCSFVHPITFIL